MQISKCNLSGLVFKGSSQCENLARWIFTLRNFFFMLTKVLILFKFIFTAILDQHSAMLSQIHHHLGISPPPPQEPHPWLDISISILYMFFVDVHVLYSEIVCTSCFYLVLNSLSLYKHHFLYLISSLTFLMVFESCGCTHTPWIPHHHKVYHSFLVFFDRNIEDNVHLGWGESWGSKYFLF